ncbi:hypothetical protein ACLETS_24520 [Enterobacter ludwigii]|uniref:hypothetical protein n=1 Tax=Enterobacter ludwigii TaxID=299767 RepID=UPI0039750866
MVYFTIEEYVAMMPVEIVKKIIDSMDDEKLLYLHLKAIRNNIATGYRPDFIEVFSESLLFKQA